MYDPYAAWYNSLDSRQRSMPNSIISITDPLPVVIEVKDRLSSHYKPLRALARWPDGTVRLLAVKVPRIGSDESLEHLLSEWCGYTLAGLLGLPTPAAHIVDVPAASLPFGRLYSDVQPGVAFATEYEEPNFSLDVIFSTSLIRNPTSVSGMVVLDTLLRNTDREGDVLALPVAGTSLFDLRYIDNTWVTFFPKERSPADIDVRYPGHRLLNELARGLPGLEPYLLSARTMDRSGLEAALLRAPGVFLEALSTLIASTPVTCATLAETFCWRGEHLEAAISDQPSP